MCVHNYHLIHRKLLPDDIIEQHYLPDLMSTHNRSVIGGNNRIGVTVPFTLNVNYFNAHSMTDIFEALVDGLVYKAASHAGIVPQAARHITIQFALVLRILCAPYFLLKSFREAIINNAPFNTPNNGLLPDLVIAFMHVLNCIWVPLARKIVDILCDRETFRVAASDLNSLTKELMAPLVDEIYDAVWLQVDEQMRVESIPIGTFQEQQEQLAFAHHPRATIEDATLNVHHMIRSNGQPLYTALNSNIPLLIEQMMHACSIERARQLIPNALRLVALDVLNTVPFPVDDSVPAAFASFYMSATGGIDTMPLLDDPSNPYLHSNKKLLSLYDVHLQVSREIDALLGPAVLINASVQRKLPIMLAHYFMGRVILSLRIMNVTRVTQQLASEAATYHATTLVEQGALALSVDKCIPESFRTLVSTVYNSNTALTHLHLLLAHTAQLTDNGRIDEILDNDQFKDMPPIVWRELDVFQLAW